MSELLRPCPFCRFKDEAVISREDARPGLRPCADADERDPEWWIECDNCLATGPRAPNEEKARELWNRHADDRLRREVEKVANRMRRTKVRYIEGTAILQEGHDSGGCTAAHPETIIQFWIDRIDQALRPHERTEP